MNKHHFLIYYVKSANSYITTTPRAWSQANPHHLNDPEARTSAIEQYLEENYAFVRQETEWTVVLHYFEPNIPDSPSSIPFGN